MKKSCLNEINDKIYFFGIICLFVILILKKTNKTMNEEVTCYLMVLKHDDRTYYSQNQCYLFTCYLVFFKQACIFLVILAAVLFKPE